MYRESGCLVRGHHSKRPQYMVVLDIGKESFTKEVASQKWDRVKLVCTQPYNKVSYRWVCT